MSSNAGQQKKTTPRKKNANNAKTSKTDDSERDNKNSSAASEDSPHNDSGYETTEQPTLDNNDNIATPDSKIKEKSQPPGITNNSSQKTPRISPDKPLKTAISSGRKSGETGCGEFDNSSENSDSSSKRVSFVDERPLDKMADENSMLNTDRSSGSLQQEPRSNQPLPPQDQQYQRLSPDGEVKAKVKPTRPLSFDPPRVTAPLASSPRRRVGSLGKKPLNSRSSSGPLNPLNPPPTDRSNGSPRAVVGGDGTWRKVSSEPYLHKSFGDGRDGNDTRSENSMMLERWSPKNEPDFIPSGRKFTKKSKRATFGSTTTLSSNTENSDDTDDNFNVVLRVRPLNPSEKARKDKFVAEFPGDGQVTVDNSGTNRSFQFNVVFEPDAAQEDVFENSGIKRMVDNALNGYTCTAFAFGQTGSGKTHTMTGPPAQLEALVKFHTEGVTPDPKMYGLMQRSFKYLFQQLRKQSTPKIIRASYLEIYNEQVIDLLNNSHRRYLNVRWSKNKGFYVENLFHVECETIDDLMAVLEEGHRALKKVPVEKDKIKVSLDEL